MTCELHALLNVLVEEKVISRSELATRLSIEDESLGACLDELHRQGFRWVVDNGCIRNVSAPQTGEMGLFWASMQAELDVAIAFVQETASTNALLRRMAEQGAAHGSAVVAGVQTAGRGRLGREWASKEKGNLYLSVLMRPKLPLVRVPLLCLASAVAVAEICGEPMQIKWPNDVLGPDGRKVAGILAEIEISAGQVDWVIVGIGINLRAAPRQIAHAASLLEYGVNVEGTASFAALLVKTLLAHTARVATEPTAILERWRSLDCTVGRAVTIGDVSGYAIGVGIDGALEIRDSAGAIHRVLSGDVEMVKGMS